MTIEQFIAQHKDEIDSIVKEYYKCIITNDKERYEWILSDKRLYEWAQQEGINI